jgi:hypothetical protein
MPGPRPKDAITLTPEQEARLPHLRSSSMVPFATVQRTQIVVLAHQPPQWQNATLAQRLGWSGNTVKRWRQRGQSTAAGPDAPRAGRRRTFTPLQRAQIVALAWSAPQQYGKPWQRWSGEKLAQGAVEEPLVETVASSTSRRGLRADKIKPWRYHSWQHSTDPQFVERALPVLDLYGQAPAWQAHGELTVCTEEQTSIQARQRVMPTKAAAPGEVVHVAERCKRLGALHLLCALVVASGLTFAQTRLTKKVADFKTFLGEFFQSTLGAGVKVIPLILDNGPPPAPKQLGAWGASLEVSFAVRLYWLPKYASWLA